MWRCVHVLAAIAVVLLEAACAQRPGNVSQISQSYTPPVVMPPTSSYTPITSIVPGPDWRAGGSSTASAEWVHLPSRVREGSVVRAWVILNSDGYTHGVRSARTLTEFDCIRSQRRQLEMSGHTGYNGTGNVLISGPVLDTGYRAQPPDTMGLTTLQAACRR